MALLLAFRAFATSTGWSARVIKPAPSEPERVNGDRGSPRSASAGAAPRSHPMNVAVVSPLPVRPLVRWAARVTSLLLFGLVAAFVIGDGGPPNIFRQPAPVQLQLAALGLMLLGFAVGWVREGLGGVLVLLGLAVINAVQLTVNGRPAPGAFPLFAVPGVLFL